MNDNKLNELGLENKLEAMNDKYHKVVNGKLVAINLPKTKHGGWPIDEEQEKLNEANKVLSKAFWVKRK